MKASRPASDPVSGVRDRFTRAELARGVRMVCGWCSRSFRAKPHHKRSASVNFCAQACRLNYSKAVFNPGRVT